MAAGLHKAPSWLKAIMDYKGTFVSAPDIAYRLCVKSIRRPEDYEPSSLRVALNASERIQIRNNRLFEDTFNLTNVMASGYSLTEATVAVTIQPPGEPPVTDVDGYVASGKPLNGIDVEIHTEENDTGVKKAGEILVKSASLMKEYFNKREDVQPFDDDGCLRTGDIGYLDQEDNLFVLARKKNCIKHAGHTIYPDDVEQVVKTLENVRQVMTVGIENQPRNGESLYVFVEYKSASYHSSDDYHPVAVYIAQKINSHFGLLLVRIFIVKPKTLPRTPNDKLQHAKLKEIFLNSYGQLSENILYPEINPE